MFSQREFANVSFSEKYWQDKFHAQQSWAWKKFTQTDLNLCWVCGCCGMFSDLETRVICGTAAQTKSYGFWSLAIGNSPRRKRKVNKKSNTVEPLVVDAQGVLRKRIDCSLTSDTAEHLFNLLWNSIREFYMLITRTDICFWRLVCLFINTWRIAGCSLCFPKMEICSCRHRLSPLSFGSECILFELG